MLVLYTYLITNTQNHQQLVNFLTKSKKRTPLHIKQISKIILDVVETLHFVYGKVAVDFFEDDIKYSEVILKNELITF